MPRTPARLLALLAALFVAATLAVPTVSASTTDYTVSEAESAMVDALNADRAAHGLSAVRADSMLMSIARSRSTDMAVNHYFSHQPPSGVDVFDMMSNAGIHWQSGGEIIAWNTYSTLSSSTTSANNAWMNSSGHKAIILTGGYKFVGVGLAVDSSGKKLWTAVFISGTPPTSSSPVPASSTAVPARPSFWLNTPSSAYRTLRWSPARLASGAPGVAYYQVQRKVDGGAWSTTARLMAYRLTRSISSGHMYYFRVRAIDKAGRAGDWSVVHTAHR